MPKSFSSALQNWFLKNQRAMPWRERRSVYHAVVSEFMLQQTQVATVIPYFNRWVAQWPNFESLAQASEADVLHAWEGLGYYSRARNLHLLAKQIIATNAFPQNAVDWLKFKGIGKYTAAAISSIVQGERVPVVDGNVVRILARVNADETIFKDNGNAVNYFADAAEKLLPQKNAGIHNEAMMELGATICTKANPKCKICPVLKFCHGTHLPNLAQLPRLQAKQIKKIEVQRAFVITSKNEILLERVAGTAKRLRELYELPHWKMLFAHTPKKLLLKAKRGIAQESITEFIYGKDDLKTLSKLPQNIVPVKLCELEKITLSGPHRKWINRLV